MVPAGAGRPSGRDDRIPSAGRRQPVRHCRKNAVPAGAACRPQRLPAASHTAGRAGAGSKGPLCLRGQRTAPRSGQGSGAGTCGSDRIRHGLRGPALDGGLLGGWCYRPAGGRNRNTVKHRKLKRTALSYKTRGGIFLSAGGSGAIRSFFVRTGQGHCEIGSCILLVFCYHRSNRIAGGSPCAHCFF